MKPPPIAVVVLLLGVAALAAGCSDQAAKEVADAFAQIIIVAMVVSFVMMIVGFVFTVGQLAVVVLNFVRPSKLSMVAGYALGGLTIVGLLGQGVEAAFPAPPAPATDASPVLLTVGTASDPPLTVASVLISGVWAAALLGSARHAQVRLAAPRDTPAT